MQIKFTSQKLGSFAWKLPRNLVDAIEALPEDKRSVLLTHLQSQISAWLFLLIGVSQMGDDAQEAAGIISRWGLRLMARLEKLI